MCDVNVTNLFIGKAVEHSHQKALWRVLILGKVFHINHRFPIQHIQNEVNPFWFAPMKNRLIKSLNDLI